MKHANSLIELFSAAPIEAIPRAGSKACALLFEIANGNRHYRKMLILNDQLGETLRSPLQALRGDQHLYWNIVSGNDEITGESYIQLDPRHLSGDPLQDQEARRERRREFKEDSHKQARLERIREPKAYREMTEAQRAYFESLGDAANDEE